MRVTIRDVSEAAGVSIATVSNVLNSPSVVAKGTYDRVTAVIRELGYKPNRAARSLQKRRTFSIGYRMPSGGGGFALERFLHRVVERAGDDGLEIVLFSPRRGQSECDCYADMVSRGAVDGFVISGTTHDDERVRLLLDIGMPFVTFGRTDEGLQHCWVDIDGCEGLRLATEHLLDGGHERVALIRWPEGSLTGDERASGYVAALAERGLRLDPDLIVTAENGTEQGRAAMHQLLSLPTPPTGVVAVQDLLALGALDALRSGGIQAGRDVAVVGFDDSPVAPYTSPPLSSVRQPMQHVGERVVELMLALLDEHEGESGPRRSSHLVAPELVVRESSRAAN